jgi:hypothetical protein
MASMPSEYFETTQVKQMVEDKDYCTLVIVLAKKIQAILDEKLVPNILVKEPQKWQN